jgi:hypothetical protein
VRWRLAAELEFQHASLLQIININVLPTTSDQDETSSSALSNDFVY